MAAAQLGPVTSLSTPRAETLARMIRLLQEAAEKEIRLVVFPELAFTTFFPGYIINDPAEAAKFFEPASPSDPYAIINSPNAKPLIDKANELGIDISFGYGEHWTDADGKQFNYNTAVYYSAKQRQCIAKYRKVHLPGRYEPDLRPGVTQQLEKRYFTPGDLGFQAFRVDGLLGNTVKAEDTTSPAEVEGQGDPILGMLICNDRRWAEGWRCYGLQGIELLLVSAHNSDRASIWLDLLTYRRYRKDTIRRPLHRSTMEQNPSKRKKLCSTIAFLVKQEAIRMPASASIQGRLAKKTMAPSLLAPALLIPMDT